MDQFGFGWPLVSSWSALSGRHYRILTVADSYKKRIYISCLRQFYHFIYRAERSTRISLVSHDLIFLINQPKRHCKRFRWLEVTLNWKQFDFEIILCFCFFFAICNLVFAVLLSLAFVHLSKKVIAKYKNCFKNQKYIITIEQFD